MYDETALNAAFDFVKAWTADEREALRNGVPAAGLAAKFRSSTAHELARLALAISHAGLKARGITDATGHDETMYLAPLDHVVTTGKTLADELLELYQGRWNGKVEPVFQEFRY